MARKANEARVNPIIERGDRAYGEGKYKDAVKEYDKALEIDPENAEIYRKRGIANRARGDEKDALKDFDKAIELDPSNSKSYLGRGLVHREMKNYEKAMDDVNRGIEISPNDPNGYFAKGQVDLEPRGFQLGRYRLLDRDPVRSQKQRGLCQSRACQIKAWRQDRSDSRL